MNATRGLAAELKLAARFALREMRGGLSGFMIFLACIALGVGAIGGVNAVARSIASGIADQGQTLLGGDLRFQLIQREADGKESAFLSGLGKVTHSANMRSMARLADGSDQTLVEVKAVDGAWPLTGEFVAEPALPLDRMLAKQGGVWGAVAPQLLFERLGLKTGDRIRLGSAEFELRATLVAEPDLVSEGFGFAPRLLVPIDGLRDSGLIQPGSLVQHVYRVLLDGDANPGRIDAIRDKANRDFPQAGWSIRDRANAAPALAANITRFSQFLTLVGLTALAVGGVGVANAVRAYLEGKRGVIASFKCLGASGRFVFLVYLLQILFIAVIGIGVGLMIASVAPPLAALALRGVLPLPLDNAVRAGPIVLAALYGFLVALAFALIPLGRARDVPATALFRELGFEARGWPRAGYIAGAALSLLLLAGIVVAFSMERRLALSFIAAMAGAFVVLRVVAVGVQAIARRAPQVRSTPLRLAIGNIHRPGALTSSVVLALGLGLTLLSALALIDGNLRRQITGTLPEKAPSFFFVDIRNREVEDFSALLADLSPGSKVIRGAMLRGRITALNMVDIRKISIRPEANWVLRGDRGLTYSEKIPENSKLVAGEWWPKYYDGEPLVSFTAEEAGELGLKIGDTVTVNVLGRDITARIASLREVAWESLGMNFVMVFSPNSLNKAPHAWIATLTEKNPTRQGDAKLLNAVTRAFPTVTAVRVKDALDVVERLTGQLALAVRAAASVALIASVLVLSGALAAGNKARVHDAVVLKVLGATRRTLIAAFSLEYLLIGLAAAIFALAAGGFAAWFVVARIMTLPFAFLPEVALATIALALVLTVGFGLIGTWRVLGQKAAPALREF